MAVVKDVLVGRVETRFDTVLHHLTGPGGGLKLLNLNTDDSRIQEQGSSGKLILWPRVKAMKIICQLFQESYAKVEYMLNSVTSKDIPRFSLTRYFLLHRQRNC